jgi:3-hydroxybutyryl-CoA dehydratase
MGITDYHIGQQEYLSKVFTLNDVRQFAKLSLDTNPVHLDEEYAKATFFKQRIVHGFLVGSLISAVLGNKLPGPGAIYLHQELNFKKPVYFGDEIKALVKIIDIKLEKSLLFLETTCYKNKTEIVIEGKAIVKLI